MTLYEFNLLKTDNEKMQVVNENGIFIDNHITKKEKCNLYAIDMFFVEVVYDSDKNKIVEFRSFKTGRLLDRYSNLRI